MNRDILFKQISISPAKKFELNFRISKFWFINLISPEYLGEKNFLLKLKFSLQDKLCAIVFLIRDYYRPSYNIYD